MTGVRFDGSNYYVDPQNGDDAAASLPGYADFTPAADAMRSRRPLRTFRKLEDLVGRQSFPQGLTVRLLSHHTDPSDAPTLRAGMSIIGESRTVPAALPDALRNWARS